MQYARRLRRCVLVVLAAVAAPQDSEAQSREQREQWDADCAALGGKLNPNTGTCEGISSGSATSGGYTAEQQAMLNLAGQFGTLLGTAIRQGFEQSARQAEINRIQRAWEVEQARQRAAAAVEEQRRRNQALLANMHGAIGASELTMRGSGSGGGLQLRTVEDMDRESASRAQTPPRSPPAADDAQQVWKAYLSALQARNEAERAFAVAEADLAGANDLVSGIRREVAAQRSLVEATPPGSEERRLAEARLAEMERGLADATRLRDQVEERVATTRANAEQADHALAAADARRRALGDGATTEIAAVSPPVLDPNYIEDSMQLLARSEEWSVDEQRRLADVLSNLDEDLDGVSKQELKRRKDAREQTWNDVRSRASDATLAAVAAQGEGRALYSSGWQSGRYDDCAVFALATASGVPYSVVATRAHELIRDATWRTAAERANPEQVFSTGGLNGGEVVMLAEIFGQAEVVPPARMADTLREGRPVMLTADTGGGNLHQIVLSRTFQHNGATWFEAIDSAHGGHQRTYLSYDELRIMTSGNGVAYRPESGTTPTPLRGPG